MTAGGKAWSGLGHTQPHVSTTTLLRSTLGMPCAEANMLAPWVQLKDVAKQSWLPQMPCLWRGVALDEKHLGKDNPEPMNSYCVRMSFSLLQPLTSFASKIVKGGMQIRMNAYAWTKISKIITCQMSSLQLAETTSF